MDWSDLGKLGDLAKQMQDAYEGGMDAMNQAGDIVSESANPDHEVIVEIEISAQVENHPYHVDGTVHFNIELAPVLEASQSPMGNLSGLLDGLGVDLGEDKDAVMAQLGQPRAVGVVREIELRDLTLYGDSGKLDAELNSQGTLLATISDESIAFNCESVFSYPEMPGCHAAIPSVEAMQENLVVQLSALYQLAAFEWREADKDHLAVKGTLQIKPL